MPISGRPRPDNPEAVLRWLGTNPDEAYSADLGLQATPTDRALVRFVALPDERDPTVLRRLVADDQRRIRGYGDRRLLAYADYPPPAHLPAARAKGRVNARVTARTRVLVDRRVRALEIAINAYLRLLLARAAALAAQGVIIEPDPDDPRNRPRFW